MVALIALLALIVASYLCRGAARAVRAWREAQRLAQSMPSFRCHGANRSQAQRDAIRRRAP